MRLTPDNKEAQETSSSVLDSSVHAFVQHMHATRHTLRTMSGLMSSCDTRCSETGARCAVVFPPLCCCALLTRPWPVAAQSCGQRRLHLPPSRLHGRLGCPLPRRRQASLDTETASEHGQDRRENGQRRTRVSHQARTRSRQGLAHTVGKADTDEPVQPWGTCPCSKEASRVDQIPRGHISSCQVPG